MLTLYPKTGIIYSEGQGGMPWDHEQRKENTKHKEKEKR